MTKPESNFEKWFVAQHGNRESKNTWQTDQKLKGYIAVGQRVSTELASRHLWDEKRKSALYAWSAKIYGADK